MLHNLVPAKFRDCPVYASEARWCAGLLFWLSAFSAWAALSQQPAWKKNMKAGIEIGFGMPYGWAIKLEDISEYGGKQIDKI